MRILHVLDHSLPLHSGYAFRTVAILREQRRLGWETIHLTTPRQGNLPQDFEDIEGWRFYRTHHESGTLSRFPAFGYLQEMRATYRRIAELLVEVQPDILHAHSPVLNALPAIRAARRHGLPIVYEVRAFWEDAAVDHGSTHYSSLRYRLSRSLESYVLRRVDHVTTICEGLRTEILSRGLPSDRVTVIPNAVDAHEFGFGSIPDEALRQKLGVEGCTVIGFAGSFYAYEGLDLLIEAVGMLAPRNPDLRVLLVGSGPHEPKLRELAGQGGFGDRFVFVGAVPHADIQRYYSLIDLLAYPRRRMRLTDLVTPLKPLEAMAQGRIFVASDVGGHRELIRNGEIGVLFPPDDARALAEAIDSMLARRADWPRIRATSRHYVETERTWAHSVARYVDIYGRLARWTPVRGITPIA
jgi:PEP-CTERM/exosortase A-associated glycosyltransferase